MTERQFWLKCAEYATLSPVTFLCCELGQVVDSGDVSFSWYCKARQRLMLFRREGCDCGKPWWYEQSERCLAACFLAAMASR